MSYRKSYRSNRSPEYRSRGFNSDYEFSRDEETGGYRLHVADIPVGCSRSELERVFSKFGSILDSWVASNHPPCYAFVVLKHKADAQDAVKELNNEIVCGSRVKVTLARPRGSRRGGRPYYMDNNGCYTCGQHGHFARECPKANGGGSRSYRRRRNRSYSRSRSRSYSRGRYDSPKKSHRSQDESRSPSHSRSRSYSRNRDGNDVRSRGSSRGGSRSDGHCED